MTTPVESNQHELRAMPHTPFAIHRQDETRTVSDGAQQVQQSVRRRILILISCSVLQLPIWGE